MKNDCGIKVVGRIAEGRSRGLTNLRTVSYFWQTGGHIFAVGADPAFRQWNAADDDHDWMPIEPEGVGPYAFAEAWIRATKQPPVRIIRAEYTHM